jgi:hypothetical protein
MSTTLTPTSERELAPSTRNVTRAFWAATAEDRVTARSWYLKAAALAEMLADEYEPRDDYEDGGETWQPGAYERAAAVIAVLSPRLSWPKNVELTQLAYRRFYGGEWRNADMAAADWPGLKSNAVKAWRILQGEDPDEVVKGPKVRAFWHTIANPYNAEAVVIDRHAFDVAVGRVMDDRTRGAVLGRKGAYDAFATVYRRAAKSISARADGMPWTPAEVQAVTWTYWRRERAVNYHGEA